ncbi:MAG: methionyl-tRNA formyltransferase [Bacteroidota bacterium]
MRIVFAGTPDFACPSLAAIKAAGHEVVQVITQPDRPCGRGQRLMPPAVKEHAACLGLDPLQPERIDTPALRRLLTALSPEAVVVVAFGQKIPPWLLTLAPLGCLNVHASLLPRYRGAAPIQRAIMNGEVETGVTIMLLDEGWDTGPLLCQRAVRIEPQDDAGSLHDRLAAVGAELLVQALEGLAAGTLIPVPQDETRSSRAPKLRPEEMRLAWHEPATKLHNLVRALAPSPLVETFHAERRLQVRRTQAVVCNAAQPPGTVLSAGKDGILVRAGEDALRLLEVKPANGRLMHAAEYARGHRLMPGTRLG